MGEFDKLIILLFLIIVAFLLSRLIPPGGSGSRAAAGHEPPAADSTTAEPPVYSRGEKVARATLGGLAFIAVGALVVLFGIFAFLIFLFLAMRGGDLAP